MCIDTQNGDELLCTVYLKHVSVHKQNYQIVNACSIDFETETANVLNFTREAKWIMHASESACNDPGYRNINCSVDFYTNRLMSLIKWRFLLADDKPFDYDEEKRPLKCIGYIRYMLLSIS